MIFMSTLALRDLAIGFFTLLLVFEPNPTMKIGGLIGTFLLRPHLAVAILVGYIASALMAGTFLAIGAFLSAFTKNQVIAFVLSGVACFLLMVIGFPMLLDFVSGWLPRTAVEAIAAMSVLTHFESMMRGVLDGRDVLYFVSVSAAFLFLNGIVVEWKKAE